MDPWNYILDAINMILVNSDYKNKFFLGTNYIKNSKNKKVPN